jgi:plastocyanin
VKPNVLAGIAVLLISACATAALTAPAVRGAANNAPAAVVVQMTNSLAFEPELVTIRAGQAVKWVNSSYAIHTATAIPDKAKDPRSVNLPKGAKPFGSGLVSPGGTFSHTFDVPGRYKYFCIPHEMAGMIGEVIVLPAGSEGAGSNAPQTQPAASAPTTAGAGEATKPSTPTFVLGAHLPPRPPDYREATGILKFIYWLGSFHPPATDVPIGLILAGFLSEVLLVATRKNAFAVITRYCVWVGGLAAFGTAILGWCFDGFRVYSDVWMLTTHSILGSVTGVWGLLLIGISELARSRNSARWTWAFRATLVAAVVLVIVTGFFGGAMIYGLHHYAWPSGHRM